MNINIQNKNYKYDKFLTLNLILICAWYIMPIVTSYLRSIGFLILSSTFIIITLFYNKKIQYSYLTLLILLSVNITVIYFGVWQNTGFITKSISLLYFFFPIFPAVFLLESNKNTIQRKIVLFSLIMIILTSFTTIIGLISHPEASRILATGNTQIIEVTTYEKINIGGYGFIYALVFSTFLFIYLYRIKKINTIGLISVLSIVFYTVYISQYTMAILFLTVILICSIFLKKVNIFKFIIIICLLVVSIFIGTSGIGEIFMSLSDLIKIDAISTRFRELAFYFIYGNAGLDSDLSLRLNLYTSSARAFLKSPFVGMIFSKEGYEYSLGHHSEVLDLLGGGGIFGFITLFGMIAFYKDKVVSKLKDTIAFNYWIWTVIFIFFFSLVNTLLSSYQIGFVILLLIPISVSFEKFL